MGECLPSMVHLQTSRGCESNLKEGIGDWEMGDLPAPSLVERSLVHLPKICTSLLLFHPTPLDQQGFQVFDPGVISEGHFPTRLLIYSIVVYYGNGEPHIAHHSHIRSTALLPFLRYFIPESPKWGFCAIACTARQQDRAPISSLYE